jgi:hypothetical protein
LSEPRDALDLWLIDYNQRMDNDALMHRFCDANARKPFSQAASSGADAIWIKSFGCAAQFADEQKLPGFTRP